MITGHQVIDMRVLFVLNSMFLNIKSIFFIILDIQYYHITEIFIFFSKTHVSTDV